MPYKILALTFSLIVLTACATAGNWQPTVDAYNDPNAFRINQDLFECRQLAMQASGGTASQTAIGTGVGALLGAAAGAAIGAAAGNPATGAAIGAAAGGFGGGAKQGFGAEIDFKTAYSNCMVGRGHHVLR